MERQHGAFGSGSYLRKNIKKEVKSSQYTEDDADTNCEKKVPPHRPWDPKAADGKPTGDKSRRVPSRKKLRINRPASDASVSVNRPNGSSRRKLQAPESGNVYHFSGSSNIRSGEHENTKSSSQACSTDQVSEATLNFDDEHDDDDGPSLSNQPDQTDGYDQEEPLFSQPLSRPTEQPAPAQSPKQPDWVDHPITKALAGFMDQGNPLNPLQIIADSIRPVSVPRGGQPEGRVQPDQPEEAPVTPIPPDQSGEAAERVAGSIDARDAFWDFWLGHQDQMRSQCIRLMAGNVSDAEDALSSAMLRASQKFPNYADSIVNGKAWLRKLVYNVCMDHYRQGKLTEYRPLDQDIDIPVSGAMFTGRQQSPEEIALSQEQIKELDRCMNNLSNNLRVPLVLRCIEGWSYPDIAEELNLRADTVRKRIQLARDHLRRSDIR